jgi:prevent-host-death family protein
MARSIALECPGRHFGVCTPVLQPPGTLAGVDRLGIRELRNQAAAAVRRAGSGERIVITVDGHPVAQLGPLEPLADRPTLDDLAARGLVIAPRRADRPEPVTTIPLWAGTHLDRLIDEVRGG